MVSVEAKGRFDTIEVEFTHTDKDGNIKEQGKEVSKIGNTGR